MDDSKDDCQYQGDMFMYQYISSRDLSNVSSCLAYIIGRLIGNQNVTGQELYVSQRTSPCRTLRISMTIDLKTLK